MWVRYSCGVRLSLPPVPIDVGGCVVGVNQRRGYLMFSNGWRPNCRRQWRAQWYVVRSTRLQCVSYLPAWVFAAFGAAVVGGRVGRHT